VAPETIYSFGRLSVKDSRNYSWSQNKESRSFVVVNFNACDASACNRNLYYFIQQFLQIKLYFIYPITSISCKSL